MNGYSGTSWWGGGQYDATQDWLSGFNAQNGFGANNRDLNAGRSNAFYDLLRGGGSMDPRLWYARAGDLADQVSGLGAGLSKALAATPEDRTRALLSVMPGMEEIASRVQAGAGSYGGTAAEDEARAASSRGRRSAEGSLSRSGALSAAASGGNGRMVVDAASEPLLNAVMRVSELRSQAYQNAINPLLQQTLDSINRRSSEYGAGIGALSGAQQGYLGAGQGLAGLLADQSQQYLIAPQVQQRTGFGEQLGNSLLSGVVGALSGGIGTGLGTGLSSLVGSWFKPQTPAASTFDPNYAKGLTFYDQPQTMGNAFGGIPQLYDLNDPSSYLYGYGNPLVWRP